MKQLELPTWGGRRKNAGRKPKSSPPKVSHKRRASHLARFPVHAVLRVRKEILSLRRADVFAAVMKGIRTGCARPGFRLVHFSAQSNHTHLLLEATDARSLSRGMQALTIRLARAINRQLRRTGEVFADHYFARDLKTPAEVRRAVRYVLDNAMLHAGSDPRTDPCASPAPIVAPQTWLLRKGWLLSRAGPLPVSAWSTFDD